VVLDGGRQDLFCPPLDIAVQRKHQVGAILRRLVATLVHQDLAAPQVAHPAPGAVHAAQLRVPVLLDAILRFAVFERHTEPEHRRGQLAVRVDAPGARLQPQSALAQVLHLHGYCEGHVVRQDDILRIRPRQVRAHLLFRLAQQRHEHRHEFVTFFTRQQPWRGTQPVRDCTGHEILLGAVQDIPSRGHDAVGQVAHRRLRLIEKRLREQHPVRHTADQDGSKHRKDGAEHDDPAALALLLALRHRPLARRWPG